MNIITICIAAQHRHDQARKLAATAFKALLARIRYPNNDPHEILLDAPLVVRRST